MQQYLQNKKGLVEGVFDQVYDRYDLMNDFMSLGIHRLWKKSLINMMNPSNNKKLVDVACGTGDIGKLFLDKTHKKSNVTSVDPNKKMISQGRSKLSEYENIEWITAPAEELPLADNSFDYYTISFGLRNTKNLDLALSEAYRVLKPGGRYLCLEFSKIQNSGLNFIYKNYSKFLKTLQSAPSMTAKEPPTTDCYLFTTAVFYTPSQFLPTYNIFNISPKQLYEQIN